MPPPSRVHDERPLGNEASTTEARTKSYEETEIEMDGIFKLLVAPEVRYP